MEHVPCPLCGHDAPLPMYELEDWFHHAEGAYRLVRCSACDVLYLNPRPTRLELARHYPPEYAPFRRADGSAAPRWRRPWANYGITKRCRAVLRLVPRGRLLDVGCAGGAFLAAMREAGPWDVVGLERDAAAASYARAHYGLSVLHTDVDDAVFGEGAFDAITLWDVLEHLPSPRGALHRMRPWLRNGGWLLIRVPNAGGPWPRLFGRYWAGYDGPRHLTTFDDRTVARLLAECGYTVRACWPLSGTHAMAALSVNAWLKATGRQRSWGRILDNFMAQAFMAPPLWFIDRTLGGALITVAAQPRDEKESP